MHKPGMLCYVRSRISSHPDNGRVVTITRLVIGGEFVDIGCVRGPIPPVPGVRWWVRGNDLHLLAIDGTYYHPVNEVFFYESSLIPLIPPDEEKYTVDHQEKEIA